MRAAALLLAAALAASAAARRLPLEVADAASVCRTGGANGQCVPEVGYCQHNAIVYCNRGAGEGCVIRDGAPVCKVRPDPSCSTTTADHCMPDDVTIPGKYCMGGATHTCTDATCVFDTTTGFPRCKRQNEDYVPPPTPPNPNPNPCAGLNNQCLTDASTIPGVFCLNGAKQTCESWPCVVDTASGVPKCDLSPKPNPTPPNPNPSPSPNPNPNPSPPNPTPPNPTPPNPSPPNPTPPNQDTVCNGRNNQCIAPKKLCMGTQMQTCGWPDAICINHAGGEPECKRPDAPTVIATSCADNLHELQCIGPKTYCKGGQLITCGWEDAICINHAGGDPECKRPDALSDATAQIMGVVAIPDTGMGATADGGLGLPSLDGLTGLGITLPSLTP